MPGTRIQLPAIPVHAIVQAQRTLLSLTKHSFFLKSELEVPFVRVAAQLNKNRRPRDLEISASFADVLAKWMGGESKKSLV